MQQPITAVQKIASRVGSAQRWRRRPSDRRVCARPPRRGRYRALLIGIWATSGGGAGKVGDLLDAVFSSIKKNIS